MDQEELVKFYGHIVEKSHSLPFMCDYQIKDWSFEKFKQYADANSSMMYAYCHKSLLPIPFNIIEEQSRARKWMSDLHTKRSLSCTNFTQQYRQGNQNPLVNSASEHNFRNINKNNHFNSQPHKLNRNPLFQSRMKHDSENYNPMNNHNHNKYNFHNKNTMNNQQGVPNPYLQYKHPAKNRKHLGQL